MISVFDETLITLRIGIGNVNPPNPQPNPPQPLPIKISLRKPVLVLASTNCQQVTPAGRSQPLIPSLYPRSSPPPPPCTTRPSPPRPPKSCGPATPPPSSATTAAAQKQSSIKKYLQRKKKLGCKGKKVLQDAGAAADNLAASAGHDNPVPGSLASPNARRQSDMLADRATDQVPQSENLMRSGNTVEKAGKPNRYRTN